MEKPRHERPGAGRVFRTYWNYLRRYPFLLAAIFAGVIVLQAANLIAPLYLRKLVNSLATLTPNAGNAQVLVDILLVVALMWFLDWSARRIQGFCVTHLESKVMTAVQTDAFEYLLGHSYNFFVSNFAGSLTHKVKQFSRCFEVIFDGVVFQFVPALLFVSGAVGVLFARNHVLGIALGFWAVAFVCFQLYVSKLRQPLRAERAEADTRVTAALADAISNQMTIAQFSGSAHEKALFRDVIEDWRGKTMRLWRADELIWSGFGLFTLSIQAVLMFGAIYFWSHGLLTIGDFVLIQAYLFTTFDRLVGLSRELRGFYTALAEAGEMVEILEEPHEVKDAPDARSLRVAAGDIEFKSVEFSFHAEREVLGRFDLSIPGGQKVALVGPSGAGKSTITKLLLRLYEVNGGSIQIDGQDIAQVTQDSLREAISFVPQEPVLFHRTLMENIRYGRRDATDEEVIEAAKQAHCHEFIEALPKRYDTYVGERGIKLSGGERQRVAIARAILKDAPILVLDEATSSLDSQSEALIQDALRALMEGKTVLVIAHRLSTVMHMDRILVLRGGAVIADGTHEELLLEEGLYHKLWSIQAGGFLLDERQESDPVS